MKAINNKKSRVSEIISYLSINRSMGMNTSSIIVEK